MVRLVRARVREGFGEADAEAWIVAQVELFAHPRDDEMLRDRAAAALPDLVPGEVEALDVGAELAQRFRPCGPGS